MKRIAFALLILLTTVASGTDKFADSIRQFIDNKPADSLYKVDNECLNSGKILQLFYSDRCYETAWYNNYSLSNNAYALLEYIRQVDQHGLQPKDYHLHIIEEYAGKLFSCSPMDTTDMIKLDLLLTDAFILLGSHLYYGKVDPEKEGAYWKMQRKNPELRLDLKLKEALACNNLREGLDLLAPRYSSYWKMKSELVFFLELNEHLWQVIMSEIPIKPGESNQLLPKIRGRLIKLRYQLADSISVTFDEELEKQVKSFQADWGLNADGVIGKLTMEYLNSAPLKLCNQLKVNMERFRWLPLEVTVKHIIVNIANFELDLIEGADTLISMRAIVGKEFRETPVFNERITYIIFSPTWTIPHTILVNDVIPELIKGPEYMERKNLKLYRNDGAEVAYSDIDWSKISKNNFPYIVRQDPGPGNALGKVKFMFPNTYDVYIHDTPSREYFARDNRALSSGCVRVEKPFDLAVLLLSDKPEWSPTHIRDAMQNYEEQTVRLKLPVDVILIYLTAWVDGKDRIQFRKDVYQRDQMVSDALNR